MGFAFADLAVPLGVLVTCLSSERVREAIFGAITAKISALYFKPRLYAKLICAGQVANVELTPCLQGKDKRKVEIGSKGCA